LYDLSKPTRPMICKFAIASRWLKLIRRKSKKLYVLFFFFRGLSYGIVKRSSQSGYTCCITMVDCFYYYMQGMG
jgi:hypothetical protein